jgi:hypothetical protein
VATQPELGLLPERRAWLGCGCRGCPPLDGQNLRKSILVKLSNDKTLREIAAPL